MYSLFFVLTVGLPFGIMSGDGSTTASVVVQKAVGWSDNQPIGYGKEIVIIIKDDGRGNLIASERL